MDKFVQKMRSFMKTHRMVQRGESIVVGISGGPDSVALLYSLWELSTDLSLKLIVAHLNHSTRGKDSMGDARFVRNVADQLGLDCYSEEKNVREIQRQLKGSFQEVARQVRQEFFDEVCAKTGAQKVALGHTRDDQAETVLMNMLRGSGSRGMSGMSPVRGRIIRPLMGFSRKDILEFLDRKSLAFRKDSSNQSPDYLRNRIRMDLIPHIEGNFNPNLKQNLANMSELLLDEDRYLDEVTEESFHRLKSWDESLLELSLEITELLDLPIPIQRRLVRKHIAVIKGDLRKVSHTHIQQVMNLAGPQGERKKIPLPDGLEVSRQSGRLIFNKTPGPSNRILNSTGMNQEMILSIPGRTRLPWGNFVFSIELKQGNSFCQRGTDSNEAFFDFDTTGDKLLFRNFQPGDRFQPLGMTGSKKLKEFFIDHKIPRQKRGSIPILTTDKGNIIWVYGWRIAHPFRVTEKTRNLLYIKGLAE